MAGGNNAGIKNNDQSGKAFSPSYYFHVHVNLGDTLAILRPLPDAWPSGREAAFLMQAIDVDGANGLHCLTPDTTWSA